MVSTNVGVVVNAGLIGVIRLRRRLSIAHREQNLNKHKLKQHQNELGDASTFPRGL
jgi:hypothetical protein